MSKLRLIGCVLVQGDLAVQSVAFRLYRPIGRPAVAVRFLDQWGVDEILLLDIAARREGRVLDAEVVADCARQCRVPLSVGGGISTVEQVRHLVRAGADKVSINGLLSRDRLAVQGIVAQLGSQCVIGAIDVERRPEGALVASPQVGPGASLCPVDWAREISELGVGEILINSIDRDGSKRGFDLDVLQRVAASVSVPVIALGGFGIVSDISTLFNTTGVRAAAIGNSLYFTEHSVAAIKSALVKSGFDLRLDSEADYTHTFFDSRGRVGRREERELIEEVFNYIAPEVI